MRMSSDVNGSCRNAYAKSHANLLRFVEDVVVVVDASDSGKAGACAHLNCGRDVVRYVQNSMCEWMRVRVRWDGIGWSKGSRDAICIEGSIRASS